VTSSSVEARDMPGDAETTTAGFAAGGLLAGLLASSCCILPLALVSLGIGGAWMSYLTALEPYQPYFLGAAILSIGAGLWRAYRKPKACLPGSACARPAAARITKSVLWTGAGLVIAVTGVNLLAPFFV
jgi:mercuric ion transport protein